MKHKLVVITILVVLVSVLGACSFPTVEANEATSIVANAEKNSGVSVSDDIQNEETGRPQGWDEVTHGKDTAPDYETVFPQDDVNRIDISISPETWQVMLDDMTEKYGEFGAKRNDRMGMEPGGQSPQMQDGMQPEPPTDGEVPARPNRPVQEGMRPQPDAPVQPNLPMEGGMGMMEGDGSNPVWVSVELSFQGETWTHVGLRFKGNSSLKNSWSSGSYKIPMKLDFDEFENEYPEIDDQRFYGFKQLSLASNFNDASLSREKIVSEVFTEAGVPSAQTAFYQVYVDYGEGPAYFGLYTMVEVVDDTLIATQFEDDSGNVYKPSGAGASFSAGSFSEASFDKETNQDEDDYDDILALYDALHAETRVSDPAAWRTNLESIFDVSGFLKYLAVNNIVQNWDTYGLMNHNYYLYHDPVTGLLTWIPWDNNEAMKTGRMREPLSLSMDEVNERWPLIRYLLDDPVYQSEYVNNVEAVMDGPFDPDTLIDRLEELHELIRPYVVGQAGTDAALASEKAFDAALVELTNHVESRSQAVSEYLSSVQTR